MTEGGGGGRGSMPPAGVLSDEINVHLVLVRELRLDDVRVR